MKPLYLFSLPRSGSTLTKRMLGSHPEITTTSEPAILLPSLYSLRHRGVMAEYDHGSLNIAVEDFCQYLPDGVDDYLSEIGEFALRLYARAAGRDCVVSRDGARRAMHTRSGPNREWRAAGP